VEDAYELGGGGRGRGFSAYINIKEVLFTEQIVRFIAIVENCSLAAFIFKPFSILNNNP
jgi:hypothetical protein